MPWESRQKNRDIDWQIYRNDDNTYPANSVDRAIMLDIREELKKLNAVMQCPNVAAGFRAMQKLNEIARRDEKNFKRRVQRAVNRKLKR
jgi:hypothetical protein